MNGRRYIECNSTYRNRIKYPNQAYFEIPFGNSYTAKLHNEATDIIINGPIIHLWQGGYGYTGATGSYSGTGLYISEGRFKTGSTDAIPLLSQTSGNPMLSTTLNAAGPTVLSSYNNYYLGYGITDVNLNQSRLILSYDAPSASITSNTAFDGSSSGDKYVIYDPSSNSQRLIHMPTIDGLYHPITNLANSYTNFYIIDETLSGGNTIEYRKITSYDNTTQLATIESSFPSSWQSTDVYTVRQTLPSEMWPIQSAVTSGNYQFVTLPTATSTVDDYYKDRFLYKLPLGGTGPATSIVSQDINNFYYVAGYTGATHTAVIQPMYSDYISNPLVAGNIVNVVNFNSNNEVPLLYSGSITSQSESVSYEIAIVDIVFPNINMSTGPRIVQYPYVYVSLESVSSSSGGMNNNILYSNNPASTRALFIITMTDTTIPLITPFLKTDSGSSAVTIKFKPNDALRFGVWLPNGQLYQTQLPDSLPPFPPNPLLQIMCVFSLRQL